MNQIDTETIRDWGVDAKRENRPGDPKEQDFATGVETQPIEKQETEVEILKRSDLANLTPVFGTTAPPKALSGMMRRAAYEIPETRPSHWFLLLIADRVDVVESAIADRPLIASAMAAGLVAGISLFVARRRRGSRLQAVLDYF